MKQMMNSDEQSNTIKNMYFIYFLSQWNGKGYDMAKLFGNKFSYISPVWLQIKRKGGGAFVMEGAHDIDKGKIFCRKNYWFFRTSYKKIHVL